MFDRLTQLHAKARPIAQLFDSDPARADRFSVRLGDMVFDYSKTAIDDDIRAALLDLTGEVAAKRTAMVSGAPINATEGRAVLHTALRNLDGGPVIVDGADVMPGVRQTLARMETFAAEVRASGITDVVNIGIGGSDLGPAMAVRALSPYHDGPRCHFVSNVDPADITEVLARCTPRTTLVIVASKTFTTIETMTNAATARDWMQVPDPGAHFAALSSATDKTAAWGIAPERVFGFEDWVGGRYSLWGPIGLSLMIAIGPEGFRAFLQGGQAMDQHFQSAEGAQNMPVMLALVGLWHSHVCGYATRAVLPYDNRLGRLPAYLQQLEMESNGKGVTLDGTPLERSGPVVWGEPGTNGQHAFYQLIHQGPQVVPCEFMVAAKGHEPGLHHQHQLLVANCLAQAEALMRGRTLEEARAKRADLAEHRVFQGNRPSTVLAYGQLTPHVLGMIVALYEHRVFVEGAVLGLNSYDQWGVELGKELATALQPVVEGAAPGAEVDGSTRGLVAHLRGLGL